MFQGSDIDFMRTASVTNRNFNYNAPTKSHGNGRS